MGFLITTVCAIANAALMLWIGYGDSLPSYLQEGPITDALYALFWFAMIYCVLAPATAELRHSAQAGVLMAWLFMAFLVSFKIKEDPFAAVRIYTATILVMTMHIPGERVAAWTRNKMWRVM